MTSQRWLWSSVVLVGLVGTLAAQTAKPTFEVASVKKSNSPALSSAGSNVRLGSLFTRTNVTVTSLVLFAFGLESYQLSGGSDWIHTDRFDINAKAEGVVPAEQLRLMVQSLLEDRFRLRTHREQRQMAVYALVLARGDARLGPNLTRTLGECKALKRTDPPPAPAGAVRTTGCGSTAADIAAIASSRMGAPVVDRTGLTGTWEYWMDSSRASIQLPPGMRDSLTSERPAADPILPSFAAALQEQLGLKLEATRGPVDVLVIDSVQQPTEN